MMRSSRNKFLYVWILCILRSYQ